MDYILVGIGGTFGSVVRYLLGKFISSKTKSEIPMGTFVINITGALLLGILTGSQIDKNIYALLGDGFLGAYTTFSTFMYEGFNLLKDREKLNAFIYIIGSLFIGIVGFAIGFYIVKF
ncbi:MAG: fluoride efflux transporter CrcB [Clostridium sp.]|nr:fluoride efflux transporter CrcB [Clostridium sp.]